MLLCWGLSASSQRSIVFQLGQLLVAAAAAAAWGGATFLGQQHGGGLLVEPHPFCSTRTLLLPCLKAAFGSAMHSNRTHTLASPSQPLDMASHVQPAQLSTAPRSWLQSACCSLLAARSVHHSSTCNQHDPVHQQPSLTPVYSTPLSVWLLQVGDKSRRRPPHLYESKHCPYTRSVRVWSMVAFLGTAVQYGWRKLLLYARHQVQLLHAALTAVCFYFTPRLALPSTSTDSFVLCVLTATRIAFRRKRCAPPGTLAPWRTPCLSTGCTPTGEVAGRCAGCCCVVLCVASLSKTAVGNVRSSAVPTCCTLPYTPAPPLLP
jgi:hypothetical protein